MVSYKREYPDGINPVFWEKFVSPNVKKARGNKCEKCNSTENIDVHHLDYKDVSINTLRLVCRSCHKKIHAGKLEDFR